MTHVREYSAVRGRRIEKHARRDVALWSNGLWTTTEGRPGGAGADRRTTPGRLLNGVAARKFNVPSPTP